jgi:glutathione S-transferase
MACGLYDSSNPEAAYACDVVIESFDGIMGSAGGALFAPEEKKQAAINNFKESLKSFIGFSESQMKNKNWSFIAGNKLSVADFMMAHAYLTFCEPKFALGIDKEIFNSFPLVKKAMERLAAPLEDYLKNREFL